MKYTKYLLLIFASLFLISFASSASATYGEFTNGTQTATINFGDSIDFEADFFTMNPVLQMKIQLFNSNGSIVYTFLDTIMNVNEYDVKYSITPSLYVNSGAYYIMINANDSVGSVSSLRLNLTVNPAIPGTDTTKPTISILGPSEGTTYTTQVKFLNFIANDTNLARCDYSTNNGVTKTQVTCVSGNVTTVAIDSVNGTNKWIVYAQDVAGNTESKEVNFFVNTSLADTTAPVITVISPEEKEYSKKKITFEVISDEDATLTFSLDKDNEIQMNNPYDHVFTYTISLSSDDHSVTFYATDTSGNKASKTVKFSNEYETHQSSSSSYRVNETEGTSVNKIGKTNVNQTAPQIIYLNPVKTRISCWQKFCNFWKAIWEWIISLFR